jgi:dolichol-phosphate mannosyltransferase
MECSVVVPTYKEKLNLRPLITRTFAALDKTRLKGKTELLVVDDNSRDGSQEEVEALAREGFPCRIIVRTAERGLSSAVIRGFEEAQGSEALLCMDADLQHPPEKVPELLLAVLDGKHEFVIGTRYAGAELSVDKACSPACFLVCLLLTLQDWPLHRRVISWGARLLARPLSPLSDPMTGFFALTRRTWTRGRKSVSPVGFKVMLRSFIHSFSLSSFFFLLSSFFFLLSSFFFLLSSFFFRSFFRSLTRPDLHGELHQVRGASRGAY